MTSLLSLVRQRYLETIRSVQPANRWKILVLDEFTREHLSTVLKTYDILEEGVQQVELIENNRSANPKLEALYILCPTKQNIDRVIRDFEPARPAQPANKKEPPRPATAGPKYAAAHIFLIDGLEDRLVDRIGGSPAGAYLKALKEIFVNFWPLEAQVYSLKLHQSFWRLYGPPSSIARDAVQDWNLELHNMSLSIVNLLATLGELPEIRYYLPPSSALKHPLGPGETANEHMTKILAEMVDKEMQAYARNNEGFPPAADPARPRGVLLITDRSMDLAAPFLHEFTYQAMCQDLLPIRDGNHYSHSFRNENGVLEEVDAVLSDDDKVWVDIRHMHMKDALDKLVTEFREYSNESASNGTSLNDLKDMLANLPGMREAKEKLSLHLSLAEKCMTLFETKKLPATASVEQQCATGTTADGKNPKTLVEEMVPLLDDPSVTRKDKVRIIALYIMHRDGVPEEDRKRLYQHAKLGPPEMDAVNHLVYLGQDVTKDSKSKRKPVFKQPLVEDAFDISRYQPGIKLMLEQHFAGKLDQNVFPYVGAAPAAPTGFASLKKGQSAAPTAAPTSLRSARPTWQNASAPRGSRSGIITRVEPRQRVVVFVAGGMTYSEVRSAYQLSAALGKDIFVGSTHIVTPESFVDDLSNLDRPPKGPRPTAMPSTSEQSRGMQPPPRSAERDRDRDRDPERRPMQHSQSTLKPVMHAYTAPSSSGYRPRADPYDGPAHSASFQQPTTRVAPPASNARDQYYAPRPSNLDPRTISPSPSGHMSHASGDSRSSTGSAGDKSKKNKLNPFSRK